MKTKSFEVKMLIELDNHGNKNLWVEGIAIPICQHDHNGEFTLGGGIRKLFHNLYQLQAPYPRRLEPQIGDIQGEFTKEP